MRINLLQEYIFGVENSKFPLNLLLFLIIRLLIQNIKV